MPIYGFDEASAKRIADTVRLVEGRRGPLREANGASTPRAAVGVRCMAGTIGSSSWEKDSYSTVTIYSGEPENESSAGTVSAYNYISDIPAADDSERWVAISNNGYGWLLIESPVASDFFRMATFEGDWEADSTAVVTFSGIHSAETATAVNYFCSIADGDVGLCRNSENIWHLVSWEMTEICTAQIIDVQVNLNTTDCAITRTLITTEQRFLRLTYPYADCSTTP